MINKLLCFMWGHNYKKCVMQSLMYDFFGEHLMKEEKYLECKHCGERKP